MRKEPGSATKVMNEDFIKAVENARHRVLREDEIAPTSFPAISDTNRLKLLEEFKPEYNRKTQIIYGRLMAMTVSYNEADIGNVVSMA